MAIFLRFDHKLWIYGTLIQKYQLILKKGDCRWYFVALMTFHCHSLQYKWQTLCDSCYLYSCHGYWNFNVFCSPMKRVILLTVSILRSLNSKLFETVFCLIFSSASILEGFLWYMWLDSYQCLLTWYVDDVLEL